MSRAKLRILDQIEMLLAGGIIYDVVKSSVKRAIKLGAGRLSKIPEYKRWMYLALLVECLALLGMMAIFGEMCNFLIPSFGYTDAALLSLMIISPMILLKDSHRRPLLQHLMDPLLKPFEYRMDKARWPNDYNPDGTRKEREWY